MYHAEYKFSLNIADKMLKEMMEALSQPVPFWEGIFVTTMTLDSPAPLTQEQSDEFIRVCKEKLMGTELAEQYVVVGVNYVGVFNQYRYEPGGCDAEEKNNEEKDEES